MKKLLSIILAISLTFTAAVKADDLNGKLVAGTILAGAGVLSALYSAKVYYDNRVKTQKNAKELRTICGIRETYYEPKNFKDDLIRTITGFACGCASPFMIAAGALLLRAGLNQDTPTTL